MSSRWFRFYSEALDDPKVQRLPPHLFKAWVNMLCLAGELGGRLPGVDDIAWRLRMSVHDTQMAIDELILAGLLDIVSDGSVAPHGWSRRQYISDSSTERVRRHRQRTKQAAMKRDETDMKHCGESYSRSDRARKPLKKPPKKTWSGDGTLHETAPDSDSESNINKYPSTPGPSDAGLNAVHFDGGGGGLEPVSDAPATARPVSPEARARVARKLGVADVDPLVRVFEGWTPSRTARDPSAMFVATAPTIWANAGATVRAACQAPAAPPPSLPPVQPSPALVASMIARAARLGNAGLGHHRRAHAGR